jgi:hypothetical protein
MTRRPDGWNSGQMGVQTGWLDRPDGWQGTWILLTCRLWIVKSLCTTSLHLSDFVQTQNEAKILTIDLQKLISCPQFFFFFFFFFLIWPFPTLHFLFHLCLRRQLSSHDSWIASNIHLRGYFSKIVDSVQRNYYILKSLIITTRYIGYLCIDGCFRLRENVQVAISALFTIRAFNFTKTDHLILLWESTIQLL